MLYITTRNSVDCHTAYHALTEQSGPDGGLYMPFHLPILEKDEIRAMKEAGFGGTVAKILNLFFGTDINGWEVETCIGKNPLRTVITGQQIFAVEDWHVLGGRYENLVRNLYKKVCGEYGLQEPTIWFRIVTRIAVLFASYGEFSGETVDISLNVGDFSDPIAAFYARKMGLPLGTILCNSSDGGAVWDLIHRGAGNAVQLRSAVCLEILLAERFGTDTVRRYLEQSEKGGSFSLPEETAPILDDDLFVAVIGEMRINSVIRSIYRTSGYFADKCTASAFGGIQDFRARTGKSKPTLLFADSDPKFSAELIGRAADIPPEAVH